MSQPPTHQMMTRLKAKAYRQDLEIRTLSAMFGAPEGQTKFPGTWFNYWVTAETIAKAIGYPHTADLLTDLRIRKIRNLTTRELEACRAFCEIVPFERFAAFLPGLAQKVENSGRNCFVVEDFEEFEKHFADGGRKPPFKKREYGSAVERVVVNIIDDTLPEEPRVIPPQPPWFSPNY